MLSMRFTDSQRRRLGLAVLASLLAHAVLLGLALGGAGAGTPGLGLPWQDRRAEARDVRVVMVPARTIAAPPAEALRPAPSTLPQAGATGPDPGRAAPLDPPAQVAMAAAPTDKRPGPAVTPEAQAPAFVPDPTPVPLPPAAPPTEPTARLGTLAPAAVAPAKNTVVDKISLDPPRPAAWNAPGELPTVAAAIAPAPTASSAERALAAPRSTNAQVLAHITPLARERALDLAPLDSSAQEAGRQIELLQTSSAEAARLEAARQQAVRELTARQEAAKQEAAAQEAARLAAARAEAARLDAERQAVARQEAAQQEAARAETARQDAVRLAATRQEAARALAAQADADTARREAARRAMGRQLDEEAARRREAEAAAARQPAGLPLSWSSARRGRLLGRTDPHAELVLYAEAWARKIQLNMPVEQVRDMAQQRHTAPLVTVALRQDGSVESVTFVVSSGVPQIDEAIRRIVQSQAPYPAFPPALARDFDVVEIRRTWNFDMAVRLY